MLAKVHIVHHLHSFRFKEFADQSCKVASSRIVKENAKKKKNLEQIEFLGGPIPWSCLSRLLSSKLLCTAFSMFVGCHCWTTIAQSLDNVSMFEHVCRMPLLDNYRTLGS